MWGLSVRIELYVKMVWGEIWWHNDLRGQKDEMCPLCVAFFLIFMLCLTAFLVGMQFLADYFACRGIYFTVLCVLLVGVLFVLLGWWSTLRRIVLGKTGGLFFFKAVVCGGIVVYGFLVSLAGRTKVIVLVGAVAVLGLVFHVCRRWVKRVAVGVFLRGAREFLFLLFQVLIMLFCVVLPCAALFVELPGGLFSE